ncbi:Beta-1,4-mannosyl-glycoprotein 4-beta-N-acetylglucosaminyltransferase [Porphyridium purpureum]|uniref:Beta-1,4-mannosyl-glycoprotein 4-beta-N-acetylglucosaminyltransferase n=1 Tax=Porphyridium purpureum TaxID=35688 RepID=A0A5J4YNZ5_PORPP|nr:Beta-1,4-mannosyl-glycoprotein 4-beta-N-acetylglucosaminyltransferase [Porphyridium purpureum]|eukprot:POR3627..scf296_7
MTRRAWAKWVGTGFAVCAAVALLVCAHRMTVAPVAPVLAENHDVAAAAEAARDQAPAAGPARPLGVFASLSPQTRARIARGVSAADAIEMIRADGNASVSPPLKRTFDSSAFIELLITEDGALSSAPWDLDHAETAEALMELVTPYVIAEPEAPLQVFSNPDLPPSSSARLPVNCSDARYAMALSGARLPQSASPRRIVDFVPIGFNLDLLEIRLLETSDFVDVYVIYESERTHKGAHKPRYFLESLATTPERWLRWKHKMMYISNTYAELSKYEGWKLENVPRHRSVRHLKESRHALARQLVTWAAPIHRRRADGNSSSSSGSGRGSPNREALALAIQNDEDEIPLAHALMHVKFCELLGEFASPDSLLNETFRIVTVPPHYKLNLEWLEQSALLRKDAFLSELMSEWTRRDTMLGGAKLAREYLNLVSGHGPELQSLHSVLSRGTVKRADPAVQKGTLFLGPASSIHLSSLNEPVLQLLKSISVLEAKASDSVFPWLMRALEHNKRAGAMKDNVELVAWTADPWCSHRRSVHISQLSADTRELLFSGIPWAVKYNQDRYPFLSVPVRDRAMIAPAPFSPGVRTSARCIRHAPVSGSGQGVLNGQECVWQTRGPVRSSLVPALLRNRSAETHYNADTQTARVVREHAPFVCAVPLSRASDEHVKATGKTPEIKKIVKLHLWFAEPETMCTATMEAKLRLGPASLMD